MPERFIWAASFSSLCYSVISNSPACLQTKASLAHQTDKDEASYVATHRPDENLPQHLSQMGPGPVGAPDPWLTPALAARTRCFPSVRQQGNSSAAPKHTCTLISRPSPESNFTLKTCLIRAQRTRPRLMREAVMTAGSDIQVQ